MKRPFRNAYIVALTGLMFVASGCMVGPKYKRPDAPVTPAYKEPLPEGWKEAQPNDGAIRGKWWEIYNDPELNALEEQVNISNQNVLAAAAQFREARDAVRIARSSLFPTVTGAVSVVNSKALVVAEHNVYNLPIDLSYQVDIWGNIRRVVRANAENAQGSAALLENARLSFHSELAQDYFLLRGTDGDIDLLERTVKSFEEFLQLTQNRFNAGVASGGDVAQADAQLNNARAQLIDLGATRAQFEHAIAILTGKPPAEVSVSRAILKSPPPPIPVGVPSTLLERRPDIAAAERQMAAANEQIGIARAAYFPALMLSASAGLQSSSLANWLTWPSRFWAVGPQMAQTLFDAGRRRAQVDQARAGYDVTVANYRQTVLTGFQEVEDHLATSRVLAEETGAQDQAVRAAEQALQIATYQYKAGTVSYLQVITSQAIALQSERTAVDLLARRMVANVLLVQALGGGWNASTLPSINDVTHGK